MPKKSKAKRKKANQGAQTVDTSYGPVRLQKVPGGFRFKCKSESYVVESQTVGWKIYKGYSLRTSVPWSTIIGMRDVVLMLKDAVEYVYDWHAGVPLKALGIDLDKLEKPVTTKAHKQQAWDVTAQRREHETQRQRKKRERMQRAENQRKRKAAALARKQREQRRAARATWNF